MGLKSGTSDVVAGKRERRQTIRLSYAAEAGRRRSAKKLTKTKRRSKRRLNVAQMKASKRSKKPIGVDQSSRPTWAAIRQKFDLPLPGAYVIKTLVPAHLRQRFVRAAGAATKMEDGNIFEKIDEWLYQDYYDQALRQRRSAALLAVYGKGARIVLNKGYCPGHHIGLNPGLVTPLECYITNHYSLHNIATITPSTWPNLSALAALRPDYDF